MKQIVCMKIVPKTEQIKLDPATKTVIREGVENEINEPDKNALELALSLKSAHGGEVVVLSMGPPMFEPHLKLAIAMGADDAVLLSDRAFAGADTYPTSRVIAAGVRKIGNYDLVLCGEASADGSTEQVPPGIAEWLGIPQVTYTNTVKIVDGMVEARRTIPGGHEVIRAQLPALVSVELGCNTPRFPDFRRKRWAEKEFKLKIWNKDDLGLQPEQIGSQGSYTTVKELKMAKGRARKKEFIKGEPEQIAERLTAIVEELL